MMSEIPKVISAKVAARYVGLAESTLAKLRLNGNGPVYCKLGRRVVYRPADLEQWLQSRTTCDTSDADARFLKALTAAHPRHGEARFDVPRADCVQPRPMLGPERASDGPKSVS